MLESLFKFPIVMVDGDNEEKKNKMSSVIGDSDRELDIIIGEAECPFHDFISITDRWQPREESFQRALEGDFDACYVVFGSSGSFVVPWSKKKFKAEYKKFVDGLSIVKNENYI